MTGYSACGWSRANSKLYRLKHTCYARLMNYKTKERMEQLWLTCKEWIIQNKVTSADNLYQEEFEEKTQQLAEMICNVVGYDDTSEMD